MPWGLKRHYGTGGLHFITWSCYRRRPLLDTEPTRDLLLNVLEVMRERYRFGVVGYVVMPEHVHILISEPQIRRGAKCAWCTSESEYEEATQKSPGRPFPFE